MFAAAAFNIDRGAGAIIDGNTNNQSSNRDCDLDSFANHGISHDTRNIPTHFDACCEQYTYCNWYA
jgi:hypothetical protein